MIFELIPVDLGISVEGAPIPGQGYRVRAQGGGGARWEHFHVFLDESRARWFLTKVQRFHDRVLRINPACSEHWHAALPEYGSDAWRAYEADDAQREASADIDTWF